MDGATPAPPNKPASPNRYVSDLDHWSAVLDADDAAFDALRPGARLGILPRADADTMGGVMLVWEAGATGMRARQQAFEGYLNTGVDIIFVPEEPALGRLYAAAPGEALRVIRSLVREGAVIFFSMRRGRELRALGYEPLLDTLGLAFLGACR
jgi:hypothetical protein